MRFYLKDLLSGKSNTANGILALCIVMLIALGCTCGKSMDLGNLAKELSEANSHISNTETDSDADSSDMPDDRLLNALIRETTADFAYSISTEDFSAMYAKASPDFQATYTEAQMRDIFKSTIANKKRLLPLLAKVVSMQPDYSPDPYIRTEQGSSILVVNGKYDVKPTSLNFTYEYVKRDGKFKLLKLLLS
ncbi:MAG: hypothetical protein ACR2IH_12815 [Pyrinomonadaceae bacterium]